MRRIAFCIFLLALGSAFGLAKEETVDELKARFASARPEDRPELGIRIAQHQLRNADRLYSEGKVEPAREAVEDIVGYAEKARDAATQTKKRLKNVDRPIAVYLLGTSSEQTPSVGSRRRTRWMLGAAAGAAVVGYLFYLPIATAVAVSLTRMQSLRLQIGYCITSDGVRIAYGTVGKGPPVVIALGWLSDLERGSTSPTYNSAFLMPIAARHLVVQYDGRGFGRSDRGFKDYSL